MRFPLAPTLIPAGPFLDGDWVGPGTEAHLPSSRPEVRHRVIDVLGLPEVFRKLPPWIAAGVVACSAARRARDLGPVVGFYQPKPTRWQVSAASRFTVPAPVVSGEISDENADVPDEYIGEVVFGRVVRWADDALLLPWPTGPRWWTTASWMVPTSPPAPTSAPPPADDSPRSPS